MDLGRGAMIAIRQGAFSAPANHQLQTARPSLGQSHESLARRVQKHLFRYRQAHHALAPLSPDFRREMERVECVHHPLVAAPVHPAEARHSLSLTQVRRQSFDPLRSPLLCMESTVPLGRRDWASGHRSDLESLPTVARFQKIIPPLATGSVRRRPRAVVPTRVATAREKDLERKLGTFRSLNMKFRHQWNPTSALSSARGGHQWGCFVAAIRPMACISRRIRKKSQPLLRHDFHILGRGSFPARAHDHLLPSFAQGGQADAGESAPRALGQTILNPR